VILCCAIVVVVVDLLLNQHLLPNVIVLTNSSNLISHILPISIFVPLALFTNS